MDWMRRLFVGMTCCCCCTSLAQAEDWCVLPEWESFSYGEETCSDSGKASVDEESCIDPWLPRSELDLPLFREQAVDMGVTLPLPLGASGILTVLKRTVQVSDVRIALRNQAPVSLERFEVSQFNTMAVSEIGRADLWVLPFLNVYGVLGHTEVNGQTGITVRDFPFPNSPSFSFPVNFNLHGTTYGGGGTAVLGTKQYFGMLDINYTQTKFRELDSALFSLVVAPRAGIIVDEPFFKGTFFVGAMYQDTRQTVELLLERPVLGPLRVSIDQFEPRPWNYLVGMLWGIDERLQMMLELGNGGRKYVITGLTVRF